MLSNNVLRPTSADLLIAILRVVDIRMKKTFAVNLKLICMRATPRVLKSQSRHLGFSYDARSNCLQAFRQALSTSQDEKTDLSAVLGIRLGEGEREIWIINVI